MKTKAKYLGHIISEVMSGDADVFRQVKCLYIRGNIISRKFANCNINVKLVVFKTYCSCLYTSQLRGTCLSRSMDMLNIAYMTRWECVYVSKGTAVPVRCLPIQTCQIDNVSYV